MAQFYVGSFVPSGSTGVQTIAGVGFTPKFVMTWWNNSSADGTALAGFRHGIGYASGTAAANQGAVTTAMDSGVTTSNTGKRHDQCLILQCSPSAGAAGGRATLNSFTSDGFSVNWSAAASPVGRVFFLCIGGAEFEAHVTRHQLTVGTGSRTVTGIPFTPAAFFALDSAIAASSGGDNEARVSFGCSDGGYNWCIAGAALDGAGGAENPPALWYNGGFIYGVTGAAGVTYLLQHQVFGSGTHQYYQTEYAGADKQIYFAYFKGLDFNVGNFDLAASGTGAQTVTMPYATKPDAIIFGTTNGATGAPGGIISGVSVGIGAATPAQGAKSISGYDRYNVATRVNSNVSNANNLITYTNQATGAFTQGNVTDWNTPGQFTFTVTANGGVSGKGFYLALRNKAFAVTLTGNQPASTGTEWAGVPTPGYPAVGVLETFTGADTSDINGRVATPSGRTWTAPQPGVTQLTGGTANPLGISSNQALKPSAAGSDWPSGILSGVVSRTTNPVEAFCTISGALAPQGNFCWLISTPGIGTTTGYLAAFNSGVFNVYKWDPAGTFPQIAGVVVPLRVGDKVGIRHYPDGTLHLMVNKAGTGWVRVQAVNDNTYSSGQYTVLLTGPSAMDDFGGNSLGPSLVTLTGNQPAATGTLAARQTLLRAVAGVQPYPTGTVTARRLFTNKTVVGAQPAPFGIISGFKVTTKTVAGAQPYPTGTVVAKRVFSARSVAGNQPFATGRVRVSALRLKGNQPYPTGVVSAKTKVKRLTGNQPFPTGVVTFRRLFTNKTVAGNQPYPTGTVTALEMTFVTVAGDQPFATGRVRVAVVTLRGNQPAPSGQLTVRRLLMHVTLVGVQPFPTGVVTFQRPTTDVGYTPMVGTGRVGTLAVGQASADSDRPRGRSGVRTLPTGRGSL